MTTRTTSSFQNAMTRGAATYLVAGFAFAGVLLQGAPLKVTADRQKTFTTAAEAIQATIDAAGQDDSTALLQLFGADGKDILESGDPAQDKEMRADFARSAHEKLQIEQDPSDPDRVTFAVGEQDWPFPVPVIREDGRWRLDPARGRIEVLARRVGRNELTAMELCRGYVEAQLEYASEDRDHGGMLQYAQRIAGTAGKQDGLYSGDETTALVSAGFAAASSGTTKAEAYHGYYFRVLKGQGPAATGGAFEYTVNGKMIGGFALVAWPAEYGVSGIQTFIINHEGVLYGKDLGPRTGVVVQQMSRFDPERSWHRIELE